MSQFELLLNKGNTFAFDVQIKNADERSIKSRLIIEVDGIEFGFDGKTIMDDTRSVSFEVPALTGLVKDGEYKSRVEVIIDDKRIFNIAEPVFTAVSPKAEDEDDVVERSIDIDDDGLDDVVVEVRTTDDDVVTPITQIRSDESVEFQFDELKKAITQLKEVRLANAMDIMPSDVVVDDIDSKGFGIGYASVFGVVDMHNTRMTPTAFNRTINSKRQIPFLWNHDSGQPIGLITKMEVDARGLKVEFRLALDLPKAREALSLMKMGLNGMSIGFKINKQVRDKRTGITDISEVMLAEVSYVSTPSNEASVITDIRTTEVDNELVESLRRMNSLFKS